MRALWADAGPDGASFDGEFVSFTGDRSPSRPPGGVPVHVGGHSEAAANRAGRLGDGFQPLGLASRELAMRMGQIREAAEEAGRDPDAVELSVSGYLPTTTEEEVAAGEAAGIDRMLLSTSRSQDLDGLADEVAGFAERFGHSVTGPGPLGRRSDTDGPRRVAPDMRRPSTAWTVRVRRTVHAGR